MTIVFSVTAALRVSLYYLYKLLENTIMFNSISDVKDMRL